MGSLAHRWLTTLLGLALSVAAMAQNGPFRDPSKHKIQFVTVQADVRLEVLDWLGTTGCLARRPWEFRPRVR